MIAVGRSGPTSGGASCPDPAPPMSENRSIVRPTRLRRLALPAALAVTVGLLAGCGGSAGSDTTSPSKTKSAPAEESESPSESPADEESGSPAAGGNDDCVVGSWTNDTESLARQMEKLMGDAVEGATVATSGSIVTTFDGTNVTAAYNTFTVTFTMSQEGVDMVMDLGFNGSGTSTYQAADGQLSIGSMDMSGVAITYTAKVGDQTMDLSDQIGDSMDGIGTSSGSTAAYTCDATTLSVAAEAGDVDMTQVYTRQ